MSRLTSAHQSAGLYSDAMAGLGSPFWFSFDLINMIGECVSLYSMISSSRFFNQCANDSLLIKLLLLFFFFFLFCFISFIILFSLSFIPFYFVPMVHICRCVFTLVLRALVESQWSQSRVEWTSLSIPPISPSLVRISLFVSGSILFFFTSTSSGYERNRRAPLSHSVQSRLGQSYPKPKRNKQNQTRKMF